MSKVLKRLYLGDVVKSFGTKQLRKLTTEKPQEDSIIGTWVLNNTIINIDGVNSNIYTLNFEMPYLDFDTGEVKRVVVNDGDFRYSKGLLEGRTATIHIGGDSNTQCESTYYYEKGTGSSGNYPHILAQTWSGNTFKNNYIDKNSEVGIALRTIKIIGGTDIYNEDLIAIIKANATKQESIVGTWRFKELIDTYGLSDGSGEPADNGATRHKFLIDFQCNDGLTSYIDKQAISIDVSELYTNNVFAMHYWVTPTGGKTPALRSIAIENGGGQQWDSQATRTITITGGEDINNETFITWLKANATKTA